MVDFSIYMHENACRSNECRRTIHPAGCHVSVVGIDAVGNRRLLAVRRMNAPSVHAVLAPCESVSLRVLGSKVAEVLRVVQDFVIARSPNRHVENQLIRIRSFLVGVCQFHVEIVRSRVKANAVIQVVFPLSHSTILHPLKQQDGENAANTVFPRHFR